ncbi:transcription factor IIIB 70 kDa subunit [Monosporozyma servazzii]
MPVCKDCKGTDFERDHTNANNDLVCKSCGMVSEDNPIVSEVTFGETSSGAAMVQGSFISAGQAHASFMSHGGSSALESREATLNNARRKLRAVSHALNIPDYITDAAFQWYKLSLANNFVQGRRSQNVIAACLYVACRKEKTHHMLIDFSSRLQVSVYSIGATFLKMVKRLHIVNLPLADPSLFIQHFAEKLDLGDKKIKVTKDAVKLAQRMSDEWMFEGRRPAGIAGACVLLACRMNNLRRTHSEIVAVSHVAEETLQERLNEFKQTNVGKLSVKEFREEDNTTKDQNSRPPSFMKNRKNERKIKEQIRKNEIYETSEEALNRDPILSQVLSAQELSSKEVLFYLKQFSTKRKRDFQRLKTTHGIDDQDLHKDKGEEKEEEEKEEEEEEEDEEEEEEEEEKEDEEEEEENEVEKEKVKKSKAAKQKEEAKKKKSEKPAVPLRRSRRLTKKKFIEIIEYNLSDENYDSDSDNDDYGKKKGHEEEEEEEEIKEKKKVDGKGIEKNREEENEDDEEEMENISERTKGHVKFQDAIDGYSLEKDPYRPQNLHLLPKTEEYLTKVTDDPDNLSDVDDEEIESVLLDEEASKLKERIWIGINEEYLIEQENKRLKEEADLVAGNTANKRRKTGPRRKRIKTEGIDPQVVAQLGITDSMATDRTSLQEALRVAEAKGDFTTADSVKTMLQRASFSKKINYDAIDGLFN